MKLLLLFDGSFSNIAIVVDPKRESTAIAECRKLQIPIISILDTNCDPNLVDIPIPANDDAVRSIDLIISTAHQDTFLDLTGSHQQLMLSLIKVSICITSPVCGGLRNYFRPLVAALFLSR